MNRRILCGLIAFLSLATTIFTILSIWETSSFFSPNNPIVLDELLKEQAIISKKLDELILAEEVATEIQQLENIHKSEKAPQQQQCEECKCECEKETKLQPTNFPNEPVTEAKESNNSTFEFWHVLADNHGHAAENVHRVKEFKPPFSVRRDIHSLEEVEFGFLDMMAQFYLNLTIVEFYRVDAFLQNNLAYPQVGFSYTLDVKVKTLANTIAICDNCRVVIAFTLPVYMSPTSEPVKLPRVTVHKFDASTRVNFVTTLFNVTEAMVAQLELMKSLQERATKTSGGL